MRVRLLPTGIGAIGCFGRSAISSRLVCPRQAPNRQEIDMTPHTTKTLLYALTLSASLAAPFAAHAQTTPSAAAAASAASAAEKGNKAGKPPVDAAASEAGVATKKPAKPGAQSGQASAPQKK
jgi:hypothetical protein